jgi:hypothetical protein
MVIRERAFPVGAAIAGGGAVAGLGVRLLHLDHLPIPLCTFRALTGIPCMGCGGTRAVGSLARLDVMGALAMHPLVTVLALAIALWGLIDVVLLVRRRALVFQLTARDVLTVTWTLVGLGLVNWVYLIAHRGRG